VEESDRDLFSGRPSIFRGGLRDATKILNRDSCSPY
jgi:hypothetical protein